MIVVFTDEASSELEAIEAYVAIDDPIAAERLIDMLVGACLALDQQPKRGPVVGRTRGVEIRQIVQRPYLILYSVANESVRIHRVFHGARSPRMLLKGLDPR